MIYEIIYPTGFLADYIKMYWILEADSENHEERVIPSGDTQIIIHFKDPNFVISPKGEQISQPRISICGQVTKFSDVNTSGSTGFIGIIFKPFAMSAFFNVTTDELTDLSVDGLEINKDFEYMDEKLLDLSNNKRVELVESFLMKQFVIKNLHHFRVIKDSTNLIEQSFGQIQIGKLSDRYDFSKRQFQRIFKKSVGISPKKFSEISKLNNAVNLLKKPIRLTDVAYQSGYYDQAQFIKSFKKHTGMSPKAFRNKH